MATLPLPELAREMAAFNRRVAESVEAEARRAEKLQQEQGHAEAHPKSVTRSAREALRHTLSQAPDAQAVWQTVLEAVKDGISGEDLKRILGDVRSVLETWLTLAEKTRTLWGFAAATGAPPDSLADLTEAEATIRQIKAEAERLYAFATRTKPAVDPALLQRGRSEVEQGRARTPEQMRAGLDRPKP
jgi:hypothetical protein